MQLYSAECVSGGGGGVIRYIKKSILAIVYASRVFSRYNMRIVVEDLPIDEEVVSSTTESRSNSIDCV